MRMRKCGLLHVISGVATVTDEFLQHTVSSKTAVALKSSSEEL